MAALKAVSTVEMKVVLWVASKAVSTVVKTVVLWVASKV